MNTSTRSPTPSRRGAHRKGKTHRCKTCGSEFYRRPSSGQSYCSRECMAKNEDWRARVGEGTWEGRRGKAVSNKREMADAAEESLDDGRIEALVDVAAPGGDEPTEAEQENMDRAFADDDEARTVTDSATGEQRRLLPAPIEELVALWYEDQRQEVARSALTRGFERAVEKAVSATESTHLMRTYVECLKTLDGWDLPEWWVPEKKEA